MYICIPPNRTVKRNAVQLYYTMNETSAKDRLRGLPVPELRYFDSTGSTNNEALHWAEQGAPDGALVLADEQTAGRGRMDRRWVTHRGTALAFSLILRPTPAETRALGLFSPLGALAVAAALADGYGLPAQVKWPNDVLLKRRKVCGILVEAVWNGDQARSVVVGIGVNVASQAVPPDDQVIYPATSVEDALGQPVDRLELLRKIMEGLFDWRSRLTTAAFIEAWDAYLAFKNEWVEVQPPGQPTLAGRLIGLAPAGELRLLSSSGHEILATAGDLRLRPGNEDHLSEHLGG
jgi:BirA family transcriptional regulator, biotin operon repressor / biotin---[acetyl-CoA-carboxylase] ligase